MKLRHNGQHHILRLCKFDLLGLIALKYLDWIFPCICCKLLGYAQLLAIVNIILILCKFKEINKARLLEFVNIKRGIEPLF